MCRAISSGIVQIASIILLLSGVVVAVVGIIGYVELQKLSTFGIPALNFPIILMGIGLVICIIAALMCCAARKQIRWLLFLIFVLLLCFFIGQAVMVGLVFGATQNANKLLTKGWNGLSASGQQLIENEFNCCGWTNQTGCNPQSANDLSFGRLAADRGQPKLLSCDDLDILRGWVLERLSKRAEIHLEDYKRAAQQLLNKKISTSVASRALKESKITLHTASSKASGFRHSNEALITSYWSWLGKQRRF